jgi:hypothetical protein
LVPPYLDDVQFGVNEGPMRVWFVRSIDLLQMLAVGVLIRESNWLAFDEAISTSSFGLVYRRFGIFDTRFCTSVFLGGFL